MIKYLFILCHLLQCITACSAQTEPIAFPGADGFGKYTTGGRGGKVIMVTNLNDNGPGSLREAVKDPSSRIIIFTISGTISLQSSLTINHGNLTIAGQSAPGDGICIRNYPVVVEADNVIIRYLRFRLGDEKGQEADALTGNKPKSDIIIDHCSISWATDECASFYRNRNFTLQWCIISESLNQSVHQKGDHGYGGIWGGEGATFHHNLIASHSSRLPRFSGSSTTPNSPDELVDFRNNVIYNWMNNNTYGGELGRYNIVANYYKPGPATKKSRLNHFLDPSKPFGKFYVSGNILEGNTTVSTDNLQGIRVAYADSVVTGTPFDVEPVEEQKAGQAFDLVLKKAGASLRRDIVDERIVNEVRSGSSSKGKEKNGIIDSQRDVGGWPELRSTVYKDTDGDGIPDDWEIGKGLNPKDAADASKRTLHKTYDSIEVYLNSLVEGGIGH